MKSGARQIKTILAVAVLYSGFLSLGLRILRRRRRGFPAVILFYHRFKQGREPAVPPKLSIDAFRRQMKHLRKWYDVIPLDRLAEGLRTGKAFRRPTVVITIDDGFRDNFDLAFPVLVEMDLPATIFLTAGLIDTQQAPWVDEIAMAVWRTERRCLDCPELLQGEMLDLSSQAKKASASHRLYERLLQVENVERERLVAALVEALRGEEEERGQDGRVMLTWGEIREMKEEGVSFGAHTLTHPVLSRMCFEDAEREILDSKRVIEDQVGTEVKHFAVPNGREEDFSEDLRALCRAGVFETVSTTESGVVQEGTDPYRLPRICPPESLAVFAFDLARWLFLV